MDFRALFLNREMNRIQPYHLISTGVGMDDNKMLGAWHQDYVEMVQEISGNSGQIRIKSNKSEGITFYSKETLPRKLLSFSNSNYQRCCALLKTPAFRKPRLL